MAKKRVNMGDTIEKFMEAVYGETYHLAMAMFNEKDALCTATIIINELREKIENEQKKVAALELRLARLGYVIS